MITSCFLKRTLKIEFFSKYISAKLYKLLTKSLLQSVSNCLTDSQNFMPFEQKKKEKHGVLTTAQHTACHGDGKDGYDGYDGGVSCIVTARATRHVVLWEISPPGPGARAPRAPAPRRAPPPPPPPETKQREVKERHCHDSHVESC